MELLIAIGSDDGEYLKDDHVGMSRFFYIYRFSPEKEELVEKRENMMPEGHKRSRHGDHQKAQATSDVLSGVDVLVGRKFGPNLPRLLKKLVCVVARVNGVCETMGRLREHWDKIMEEKRKGEHRKHIVL